jgi:hypothetical protein
MGLSTEGRYGDSVCKFTTRQKRVCWNWVKVYNSTEEHPKHNNYPPCTSYWNNNKNGRDSVKQFQFHSLTYQPIYSRLSHGSGWISNSRYININWTLLTFKPLVGLLISDDTHIHIYLKKDARDSPVFHYFKLK